MKRKHDDAEEEVNAKRRLVDDDDVMEVDRPSIPLQLFNPPIPMLPSFIVDEQRRAMLRYIMEQINNKR